MMQHWESPKLRGCCLVLFAIGHYIQSSRTTFHHKLMTSEWMNSSIIYNSICSLITKEYHPNNHHSDIKYHMILNVIFSVAGILKPHPLNSIYIWAGSWLFPPECGEQAIYMEIHLNPLQSGSDCLRMCSL